ncbi:VOC family protein [Nocardiopsis baichengensis]|uniref:VOC family protein n=1 Tax=Nocardiopsis baichengensis TaxID=280240 RepID=UPI00035D0759|nr:VOC family protein [Nocardiopsis baichengensis]
MSRLDLVTILVRDMERTKAFYTGLLGFSVVERFTSPDGTFVWLRSARSGSSIALQDAAARSEKPTQADIPEAGGGLMLGFAVEDAELAHKAAVDSGFDTRTGVVDMGKGRTFGLRDPEGNYIQVFDVYPEFQEVQRKLGLD